MTMEVRYGRRPKPEDVEALRAKLRALEERYKYVPTTPEGEAAITNLTEEIEEIEARVQAEQRRLAAVKAAKEREKLKKEAEVKKARAAAREELPGLAQDVETSAREFWAALTSWARSFLGGIEEIERLADRLAEVRERFNSQAHAAREVDLTGPVFQPSPALKELLKYAQAQAGPDPGQVDPDLYDRLNWAVSQVRAVGVRGQGGFGMPLGGPSLGMEKARKEAIERRRRERERAMKASKEEEERRKEAEQAELVRRILEREGEVAVQLKKKGYTDAEWVKWKAKEIAQNEVRKEIEEEKARGLT